MEKVRIGIIGCADIAYRRFLPALKNSPYFEYIGIASRDIQKTEKFIKEFGGKGYGSYEDIINDSEIDALYIPLPPALHTEWAKRALEKGKHVLLEKPFTVKLDETMLLINMAKEKKLAVFENYMFQYHTQLEFIQDMIKTGKLGDIRNYKISFGFPMRASNDFRYSKTLGGGALLDCGGYTIKLANILLGESSKIEYSKLNYVDEFEVDIFGTVTMENEEGISAQLSFGMDNSYKCELEVWGSQGCIVAHRIFTAGEELEPKVTIETAQGTEEIALPRDNQFLNSINNFYSSIVDLEDRLDIYDQIIKQSMKIEHILKNN